VPPVFVEASVGLHQPREDRPVKVFGERRVAGAVGVAEGVAVRRGRAAYPRELLRIEAERVADAVERERVREMPVEQRDDMARDRECPCLCIPYAFAFRSIRPGWMCWTTWCSSVYAVFVGPGVARSRALGLFFFMRL